MKCKFQSISLFLCGIFFLYITIQPFIFRQYYEVRGQFKFLFLFGNICVYGFFCLVSFVASMIKNEEQEDIGMKITWGLFSLIILTLIISNIFFNRLVLDNGSIYGVTVFVPWPSYVYNILFSLFGMFMVSLIINIIIDKIKLNNVVKI